MLCLVSSDKLLVFEMVIDLARLSLATGEGCLAPWLSEFVPWHRDVGDGLILGVGTVRVGDTLGFGWCSNGDRSFSCEVVGESLSFGVRGEGVREEFDFGTKMEMLGFAERVGELCVLGLVLGRVEALSPWFICERCCDLLQGDRLDVFAEQIGIKDLESEENN